MAEVHYLISDASKKVDVESHVLRYWEDELELDVPRNDMGHRYYTEYHIRLFRQIKELKEKGYQLKAIKNALNKMAGVMEKITITEDYMEEDMKAAWDEGHVREAGSVWVSEPLKEQSVQAGAQQRGESAARAGAQQRGDQAARARERQRGEQAARARELQIGEPVSRTKEQQRGEPASQAREQQKAEQAARSGETQKTEQSIQNREKSKEQTRMLEDSKGKQAESTKKLREGLPESQEEKSGPSLLERTEQQEQSKVRSVEGVREQLKARLAEQSRVRVVDGGTMPAEMVQRNIRRQQESSQREPVELNAEKMARFQSVMNHIIGRAMDANMDRLAREVSNTVSEDVTDKVMKEVEYLMRVSDEKEEERFRQLDETIRAYQKQGKGRAEAAATKVPFFKKKKFGKSGKKLF